MPATPARTAFRFSLGMVLSARKWFTVGEDVGIKAGRLPAGERGPQFLDMTDRHLAAMVFALRNNAHFSIIALWRMARLR